MTNQQGAPEALRPITRYEVVDCIDSKHVPAVIPNKDGPWVRYEDHAAALVEAQQPAPSAAAFDEHGFRDWVLRNLPKGSVIGNGEWWADHLTSWAKRFVKAAPQPSTTPQADSAQAEPLQAFDSPRAKALMRAWEEGWAACRDAEYVGEEAQNDAFNSSNTLTLCIAEDQQLPAPQADSQPAPDNLRALFREALAWGMTYGPEIPAHQWDEMRESMVEQYASRAARAPADSQPAPQGETNVQLDTDSNHSTPGQQWDVAGPVALGQPMGDGPDQAAGHLSAQGDKLLTVAERNIRSFLRSAVFKSESDREAALNCVDVLWAAARAPSDSVTAPAGGTNTKTAELLSTTVGLLMGYREGGARQPYKPGGVIAKTVDEVVEHLKNWPYPEPAPPTPPAQEDSVPEDAAPQAMLSPQVPVSEDTLRWWRELTTVNPQDLAPRIDAYLDAARKQGGKP